MEDRKIGDLYKESKITYSKTTEKEEDPLTSPRKGILSLDSSMELGFPGKSGFSVDSREAPKSKPVSQQKESSLDETGFPGTERIANNELPDHAIAYPSMLSPIQKTEDRFHRDRNYQLKLEKFISVWNENKPDDWLIIKAGKGAFRTQLTTAMKR